MTLMYPQELLGLDYTAVPKNHLLHHHMLAIGEFNGAASDLELLDDDFLHSVDGGPPDLDTIADTIQNAENLAACASELVRRLEAMAGLIADGVLEKPKRPRKTSQG